MDETNVEKLIMGGYLTKEFSPIKCLKCNSTHHKDTIKDKIQNKIVEFERVCECGNSIGYWIKGKWQLPIYEKIKEINPELSKEIKDIIDYLEHIKKEFSRVSKLPKNLL